MNKALKTYCEHCGEDVAFETQTRQEQVEHEGMAYSIRRQVAQCEKCGTELPFEPYEQAAQEALEAAVASGAGTATPEQIRMLPRKYAIGKRPLSRLLGWGELTYTRLLDGRTPNAAHSAEIIHLLNDPTAYARILEIGHEQGIITGVAYEKSRRAVDALLEEKAGEEGNGNARDALKVFAVADRLCALANGDLTPRMLQTLMRLAQEASLDAGEGSLFEAESVEVDWGIEYPQISAVYSFDSIQAAASRVKLVIEEPEPEESPVEEATEAVEAVDTPETVEPIDEPESGKKGKKGKKDKKAKKGKKEKKGKKGKRALEAVETEEVAPAAEAPKPAPIPKPKPAKTKRTSPLSPAECKLIDDTFARYNNYLQKGLARSFR